MIAALTNHLWQTTLFVGAVAVIAMVLRRNSAQIRYALWMSASLKFLIPFSVLVNLGYQLQYMPAAERVAAQIAVPSVTSVMVYITEPFPQQVSTGVLPESPVSVNVWPQMIFVGVWLAGFVMILAMRLRGWSRIRCAIRTSAPLDIELAIAVRTSTTLLEPGVFGFFRPILLLPSGLLDRLTAQQLEAVLAHELCHVRRRDNLTALIQMLVESIFWFHPLVWWVSARLVEERERACDEEVLRLGNEPHVYAEGILTVVKNYQESSLACVSGVTGSNLKKRIENIMANRDVHKLTFIKAALLVVVGVLAVTIPIATGAVHSPGVAAVIREVVSPIAVVPEPVLPPTPIQAPPPTPQTPPNDRFEVVSIRVAEPEPILPGARGVGPGGVRPCGDPRQLTLTPGRLAVRGYSVLQLIAWAYGKDCNTAGSAELITGWPDWTLKQGFDIQATLPAGTPTYAPRQLQRGEAPRLQAMLRNMLAERFQLKLHRDSKDVPIYNVTFVPVGKITRSDDQVSPSLENTPPPPAPPGPPDFSGPLVRGALTI